MGQIIDNFRALGKLDDFQAFAWISPFREILFKPLDHLIKK